MARVSKLQTLQASCPADEDDIAILNELVKKTFLDFVPADWGNSTMYGLTPSPKFLDRISLRYTKVRPIRSYSGTYYSVFQQLLNPRKIKYLLVMIIDPMFCSLMI